MKNFKKIKGEVYKLVKKAAYSPKNKFTSTAWDFHILSVVEHSLSLGRKLKADLEVLELSALLHDYACFTDASFYEEHHIHGACLAGELLKKLEVSQKKIETIQDCIMSHRGSVKLKKKTLEAKILASADAMSHISEIADLFYLAYGVHKYKTREGAEWLIGKLERSWAKIMPEGKNIVRKDYLIAMNILKRALEK